MRFPFNDRKTAQAAAHLVKLGGGKLNYMKLIKLLYLADREMLVKHGQPITGDQMVSMKHGPVLSQVLDFISHGSEAASSAWFEYIGPQSNYEVALVSEAPTDELSRFELQLLQQVFQKYGHMEPFALRDLLHQILPEWRDPGHSASDIDPEDILRAEAWSESDIRQAERNADELRFLASVRA